MSSSSVWIQLYYRYEEQEEPVGGPIPVEKSEIPHGGIIAGLVKRAAKEELKKELDHAGFTEIFVFSPDTKPPFSQDKAIDPRAPVPTTSNNPLIVVAPSPDLTSFPAPDQSEHPQARFRLLAESAAIHVSEVVMKVVVKYFHSRMIATNTPDQAADLYREAAMIPRSVTEVELAQQHISIGQLFHDAASSKTVILEAFDGGSPCLLKVTDEESLNHEMGVWEAIEAGGGASDHHLVPLKKLPFERKARVQVGNMSGGYNERGEFSGGILMQKYQSTLARCKIPLTEEVLLRYGNQLLTAITKMHECGYCHMDIKPSNVFLWQGNCLLGDYGGASRPGEKVREHTHSYYPDGAGKEAKKETDFLLLAVTLLEMFGCVTSPPGPMTKDEIKSKVASLGNEKVKAFLGQLVV